MAEDKKQKIAELKGKVSPVLEKLIGKYYII